MIPADLAEAITRTPPDREFPNSAGVPGYTPEWLAARGEPGTALANVFARFVSIFLDGLRQTPERAFLSFLDAAATSLLPAQTQKMSVGRPSFVRQLVKIFGQLVQVGILTGSCALVGLKRA